MHDHPLGSFAPDGSPVEVYRRLPSAGEPELIHGAVPTGSELLELGCGTGRVTHPLLRLGHRVVAVDDSPEMLRAVQGAETILGDIATLDLGRRFRGVVLASHLVNTADRDKRRRFLDTCRRHVAEDGVVIIERLVAVTEAIQGAVFEGRIGDVTATTTIHARAGDVLTATTEYSAGSLHWQQDWTAEFLDDDATREALRQSGLDLGRFLDERRKWLTATPAP